MLLISILKEAFPTTLAVGLAIAGILLMLVYTQFLDMLREQASNEVTKRAIDLSIITGQLIIVSLTVALIAVTT